QRLGLRVGDLLVGGRLGDVRIGGRRESGHQTRLALVWRRVGDLAEAGAGKLHEEVLRREPEIGRRLAEEIAYDFSGADLCRRRVLRRGEDGVFLLRRDDALLNETIEEPFYSVPGFVLAQRGRRRRRDSR